MILQMTAKQVSDLQDITKLAKEMHRESFEVKREWLQGLLADRETMQSQIGDLEKALDDCIDGKKKGR